MKSQNDGLGINAEYHRDRRKTETVSVEKNWILIEKHYWDRLDNPQAKRLQGICSMALQAATLQSDNARMRALLQRLSEVVGEEDHAIIQAALSGTQAVKGEG